MIFISCIFISKHIFNNVLTFTIILALIFAFTTIVNISINKYINNNL